MRLLRLTERGIEAFNVWLDGFAVERSGRVPAELVEVGSIVCETAFDVDFVPRRFSDRFDWGLSFDQLVADVGTPALVDDQGMWCWLTLVLFDQVCPPGRNGSRKLGQRARYVPTGSDYRTHYRHLLEGPWRLARAHRGDPECLRGMLAGPLDRPGEIYEQLAARQELATSRTVAQVATALYVDPITGLRKKGSGGNGPGTPRRLADVLSQLDVTFDIYGMSSEQLLGLLPKEFDRFKK